MSARTSRLPQKTPGRTRSDAVRNRALVLAAAGAAFAAAGFDVPMAAIARRAGVGMATLYRHFPTREVLVTEVFADRFRACAAVAEEAFADDDPWRGFCTLVTKVCAIQAEDRGFTAAFLTAFPTAVDYERERARAEDGFVRLAERAVAAGSLRADFALADLIMLLVANDAVIAAAPAGQASAASRRLVAYLLQSFAAGHDRPLPPAPRLELHHVPGHGPARTSASGGSATA
ncbi:TetR/AcrR family transcriptional regulator [Catellatospora sp. KI3]|uniref:TetR/AcrR family transcriptional regulator n=1 Tax=Catellatospora sp. KI3 TaxID=3041620 RepID=UPI002482581A|nr:TetR/AcrR family transcriptional regulator [Catellatospora sp. KI3]MDI1461260.1 TetR/AcrR family transcriptional regulator [Catellatospora sp. KI3]